MRKDIEKYELIERYLKNDLSDSKYHEVELRIKNDREFAHEVRQHLVLMDFINEANMLEIKDSIRNIHLKANKSFLRKLFNNRLTICILSALIFISFFALYLNSQKETIKPIDSKNIENKQIIPEHGLSKQSIVILENKHNQTKSQFSNNEIMRPSEIIVKTDIDHSSHKNLTKKEEKPIFTENIEINNIIAVNNIELPAQIKVTEDKYDCNQTSISAEVLVENSCIRQATGKIIVDHNEIEGGTPPYKISIDNEKTYQTELRIGNLPAGSYTIWLTDKNKCSEKLGIYWISSIDCETENYEYIFAPDKFEKWKIPGVESSFQIEIYNQQGILVYNAGINEYTKNYWDGFSNSGTVQAMGIYSFIIRTTNHKDVTGNVTIVR